MKPLRGALEAGFTGRLTLAVVNQPQSSEQICPRGPFQWPRPRSWGLTEQMGYLERWGTSQQFPQGHPGCLEPQAAPECLGKHHAWVPGIVPGIPGRSPQTKLILLAFTVHK